MPRRPTLRDVAERAGVHPGTASRALDPALPGRVTEVTARRVREAARELGYAPDPIARTLRTRRSGLIGVLIPDLMNPVLPPIVRGIEETLWDAGRAVVLADTDNDAARESTLLAELQARRCEGLIVATATRTSEAVRALAGGDVPAVLVTRAVDDTDLPLVAGDDAAGVMAAVDHLTLLSHDRIAYLTGPLSLSTTIVRLQAYLEAMSSSGAEPIVRHGEAFTAAAGRRLTAELLNDRDDVTAILAGNDLMALGVYEALAEAGLRCPADVSVVGHNDMPFVARLQPPLTTVAIPQREIGVAAARVLLRRLDGDAADDDLRRLLPTRLVVRGSTIRRP